MAKYVNKKEWFGSFYMDAMLHKLSVLLESIYIVLKIAINI